MVVTNSGKVYSEADVPEDRLQKAEAMYDAIILNKKKKKKNG